MLQVKDATRKSDKHCLLSGIHLEVNPGEFVSVLGPTGSGKTSLLRLIMGLDLLQGGEVCFNGLSLARAGRNLVQPENRRFAFVFEKTDLLPFLNVEKNICIGARIDQGSSAARLERILQLLRLSDLRSRSVAGLSGGEQQLVAVGRALFVQPALLLLDEPFRNIDRPARDRLIPALKGYLQEQGTAAILVTHDRDEAFWFSQRIFLLRNGQLVTGGTPEQLYRKPHDEWDARLLGEGNLLPGELARKVLDVQVHEALTTSILVRPEQIVVEQPASDGARLQEDRFFGFYRTLIFQLEYERSLQVKVFGDEEYQVGKHYRLRLKPGSRVVEVRDPSKRETEPAP